MPRGNQRKSPESFHRERDLARRAAEKRAERDARRAARRKGATLLPGVDAIATAGKIVA